jgi:serine/threonine-protein kinase
MTLPLRHPIEPGPDPAPDIKGYDSFQLTSRGAQALIFRARHVDTGRQVAVKIQADSGPHKQINAQRLHREAQLLRRLDHSFIVRLHSYGHDQGRPYIVMPFVKGRTLDKFCNAPSVDFQQKCNILIRVADGLGYLHGKRIFHRDLKPANILVAHDGTPCLLDLGLAILDDSDQPLEMQMTRLSLANEVLGTLPYLSPEQACGQSSTADARADVYAWGVIAYEILTGTSPTPMDGSFQDQLFGVLTSKPPHAHMINPNIPRPLSKIIMNCLEKSPQNRPQSGSTLAWHLKRHALKINQPPKRKSLFRIFR